MKLIKEKKKNGKVKLKENIGKPKELWKKGSVSNICLNKVDKASFKYQ